MGADGERVAVGGDLKMDVFLSIEGMERRVGVELWVIGFKWSYRNARTLGSWIGNYIRLSVMEPPPPLPLIV